MWWLVEDRKADWELIAERSSHRQALKLNFWKNFHWSCMKRTVILSPFTDEVCTNWSWTLDSYFLSCLDWRLVTEVSQLNAWARAGKKIFFCPFDFLFGHITNILLTELGRFVWENLDLGRWYRPHCVRSVLATSVKILPYRAPALLIRTKNCKEILDIVSKLWRIIE